MTEPTILFPKTFAAIQRGIQEGLHLGAQVYVSRSSETIADFALGENRPGVPMRTETLMPWLSSGKPVTAVVLGQLAERHRLEFNAPVARYIPEFSQNGKEKVTVYQLLTHTAGFRQADRIDETLCWAETIDAICQTPLEPDWPLGEKAGYHMTASWFILAEMAQRITGRDFTHYVREEVFLPIQATDCWIGMPAEVYRDYGDRIGILHKTDQQPPVPRPFWDTQEGCAICRPGSTSRGPVRELGRFYEMLLHGGSWNGRAILDSETVQLLTARHRAGLYDHTFRHILDWGLGFIINSNRYGAETVPYGYGRYASESAFGHSGSQTSCGFADPEHGLVVAWVCNGMPGERKHQGRAREINSAIYEDLGLVSCLANASHNVERKKGLNEARGRSIPAAGYD